MDQKWSGFVKIDQKSLLYSPRVPNRHIDQTILPFQTIDSLLKLPFIEINAIISSVIPVITAKQKDNKKVMPDHQDILGELENCFRSVLE